MRILHLSATSGGGVGRHMREAAELLAQRGHRVLLAAPAAVLEPGTSRAVRAVELDIAAVPRPAQDARAIARIRALAGGADILHAHGLRAGALAVLAARSLPRRPRIVVTLHNRPVGGPSVRTVGSGLLSVIATGADVVLGVSQDLIAQARALGARRTQRALVPAPARVRAAAAQVGGVPDLPADLRDLVPAGAKVALTVGRLAPQKGLELLVEAARTLEDRPDLPPYRWLVVGDGPLRPWLAEHTAGLPVEVLGRREDVADLMAAADVVVNTSLWEGQPLVVQEALAAAAAIVATDVGGTAEVCRGAAHLVPPHAPAVAGAVASVLGDNARRDTLRWKAHQRAAQLPTPEQLVAQLEDVYRADGRPRTEGGLTR